MFNHLYLQGKCTYVTYICHVLIRAQFLDLLVVGIFGKFQNWHLFQSKFWLLIGKSVGYNQNFDFCPSCQSNLFLLTWFVLTICEILPLAPFLCSNLQLVCCQMGNFYYFSHCLACWQSKLWHFAKFRYLNKICGFLNVSKGLLKYYNKII